VLCRAVQGLAAAGTWSVGNAVVADVYPMEIRGVAFGIFMGPGVSQWQQQQQQLAVWSLPAGRKDDGSSSSSSCCVLMGHVCTALHGC
jgi:hypothetical protein